jgi:hypothetical protein
VIRPLAAIGAIEKRSGGSRRDVLEGGRYSGIPYNRRCAVLTTAISRLKLSARSKTMWTLPPLWTHRTRPQGFGISRTEREIPTAPTSIIVL